MNKLIIAAALVAATMTGANAQGYLNQQGGFEQGEDGTGRFNRLSQEIAGSHVSTNRLQVIVDVLSSENPGFYQPIIDQAQRKIDGRALSGYISELDQAEALILDPTAYDEELLAQRTSLARLNINLAENGAGAYELARITALSDAINVELEDPNRRGVRAYIADFGVEARYQDGVDNDYYEDTPRSREYYVAWVY